MSCILNTERMVDNISGANSILGVCLQHFKHQFYEFWNLSEAIFILLFKVCNQKLFSADELFLSFDDLKRISFLKTERTLAHHGLTVSCGHLTFD